MSERRDSSSFRGVRARYQAMTAGPRGLRCHASRSSTSADGVHFSLSIASRPVRCRSKRRTGAPSFPRKKGNVADRYSGRRPTPRTVFEIARTRLINASGPTQGVVVLNPCPARARTGVRRACTSQPCSLGLLCARYQIRYVCDDSVSGTRRTRLETRTKESSMCASHWVRS